MPPTKNPPGFDARAYPAGSTMTMRQTRDGWQLRSFAWPVEGARCGAILFQGGRGDFIEKYLETFAHWHAAGWSVTAFDWRGQGGSGRVTANPHLGHISDFSLWIDDLAEFWQAWQATHTGPHIAVGHSMGGHLILRSLIERTITPAAAVLTAPMLGFETPPLPVTWTARIVGWLVRLGWAERPAWKGNERPALPWATRQRFLTSDLERYADEQWWLEHHPELKLGPPSLGWLANAYRSTLATEAPGVLEGMNIPVLIIGTDGDKLVSPKAIRRFATRLPNCTLEMFDSSVAHEILRERDDIRDRAIEKIDAFLADQPRAS